MNEWRKMTNFELGVRVPLMIRTPWLPNSVGGRTPALVEAVDLFPCAPQQFSPFAFAGRFH